MTEKKADEKANQEALNERAAHANKQASAAAENLEDIELDDIEEVETKAFA